MHLDAYLNACPGYGWEGGPEFKTQIVELASGRERRNADWAQARHRYSAAFNNIGREAYREIKRMHLACRGALHAFRFRDELDHTAASERFGTGDGTQRTYQLSKNSTAAGATYTRTVHALRAGVTVKINGATTTAYSLDMRTGALTFNVAPPLNAVLQWSGEFDVWVRFAEDYLPFTLDAPDATNGAVNLIEVAPPATGGA